MSRAQLRMILVLAGILPTLVAVAFAGKVITMLSHDRDGRGRFDDAEYVGAADEFSANGSINWFESWIAAFDEGAARHADDDLEGALELYAIALEDVPIEEECTVRINAALAHETLGDAALEADQGEGGHGAVAGRHRRPGRGRLPDRCGPRPGADRGRRRGRPAPPRQATATATGPAAEPPGPAAEPSGPGGAAPARAEGARARGAQRRRDRGAAGLRGRQPRPRLLAVPVVKAPGQPPNASSYAAAISSLYGALRPQVATWPSIALTR